MTQYLIAFDDGDMDHIPEADMPDVSRAVRALLDEAKAAGAWVFTNGLPHQTPSVVAVDGTVTDGPYPESKEHLGGVTIVEAPSRAEAIEWAKKIAVACRCPQQVFEFFNPNAKSELTEQ